MKMKNVAIKALTFALLAFMTWIIMTGILIQSGEKFSLTDNNDTFVIFGLFVPLFCAIMVPVLMMKTISHAPTRKKSKKGDEPKQKEVGLELWNLDDNMSDYDKDRIEEEINARKDNQIVCFSYGHIVRMYPEPSANYYDNLDLIFKANHIECDMVSFDLTNVHSIRMIPIPNYRIHVENRIDQQIGSFGSIEHLLKQKSDQYYNESKYDLSLACAKKAAELMQYSDVDWAKSDYQLIIWRLEELGETETAKHLSEWVDENILTAEQEVPLILSGELNKELSFVHKEIIVVKKTTLDAMRNFSNLPYDFNMPIKQDIEEGVHPSANMDLDENNQKIAIKDLEKLNNIIDENKNRIKRFHANVKIPIAEIIFKPHKPGYGYSHIVCTPYTPTGRISKHPMYLFFTTPLEYGEDETHGRIYYGKNGLISKADVCIWKRKAGFAFSFKTVEGSLILSQAQSTLKSLDGSFVTVYKYEP